MARKRLPPTDPREWLNRAHGNLVRAKARTPGAYLEDLCFDAQQAAEKAIKSVYVHNRLAFRFTRDLAMLLTHLARSGVKVPKYVQRAGRLTRFAVVTRYPEMFTPVTEAKYQATIRIVEAVVGWAERQLSR